MKRPKISTETALRSLLAIAVVAGCAVPLVAQAATTGPVAPKATTGAATVVRPTSATLVGTVDPGGAPTSYFFEYGPTIAYGKHTTPGQLPAGTVRVKIGQPVTGLVTGYHYRLVATNTVGTAHGKDRTFGVKRKSTLTKLVLPKPTTPTVYGSSYTLSGTMTGVGNANRPVVLEASPYPFLEAFTSVGAATHTDAAGRFTFRVPSLTKTTQFRVSTLDPRPIYSRAITQLVAVKVDLKVRSSGDPGLVRLYGTVTPAAPGAHVNFQLFKHVRPGNSPKTEERTTLFVTQFGSVVKKGTAKVSRFSIVMKIARAGSYRAYVIVAKKGAVSSGWSRTVLLHAAPGSAKRR
ncbi:MAG: hypothetical protein ACYDHT_04285 [Solirubrobacteraceae bacterium]